MLADEALDGEGIECFVEVDTDFVDLAFFEFAEFLFQLFDRLAGLLANLVALLTEFLTAFTAEVDRCAGTEEA